MGRTILSTVLDQLNAYGVEDIVYVQDALPFGGITASTPVIVREYNPATPGARPEGMKYFLEVSVIREIVEGLESELGRKASHTEKVSAVRFYAEHDSYIDTTDWPK